MLHKANLSLGLDPQKALMDRRDSQQAQWVEQRESSLAVLLNMKTQPLEAAPGTGEEEVPVSVPLSKSHLSLQCFAHAFYVFFFCFQDTSHHHSIPIFFHVPFCFTCLLSCTLVCFSSPFFCFPFVTSSLTLSLDSLCFLDTVTTTNPSCHTLTVLL